MPQILSDPASAQIAELIRRAMRGTDARVQRIETPAGGMWLKRVERLPLRWRLQKGDPARRFRKDRAGLHLLGAAGLPVAPIVAEGPDFFVTPDLGPTLAELVADPQVATVERAAAFRAAGRALAAMHLSGYCHGRPALRDMCWDGQEVAFIDLERFSARRRRHWHRALDVVTFVHSTLMGGGTEADLDRAMGAYRLAAGEAAFAAVGRLGSRLRWVGPLADRIARAKPRARDVAAVRPTLRYLQALH